MKQQEKVISLTKICKSFPLEMGGTQQVLFDITFDVHVGEFVAIMGPSGSGKSTCMNIIGALDTATSGKYELYGRDVTNLTSDELAIVRNEYIGFVFQQFNLLSKRSVLDNVMLPLMYRGMPMSERIRRAREMLSRVGLEKFESYLPNQLSGGMKQRVAIIRSMINHSETLLMDEPFSALDFQTKRNLQEQIVENWRKRNRSIVFVTHDVEEAVYLADEIVVFSKRPGTIKKIINDDLPRPRDRDSLDFHKLMVEVTKHIDKTEGI